MIKAIIVGLLFCTLVGCAPVFTAYLDPKEEVSGSGETIKIISTSMIRMADGKTMKIVKYQEVKRKR